MKQLGIVINQARLEQEGLNLGIFDGVGQMNAAQKAIAVQSIMIRDLGTANGDAAATAESAANQVKFLKKELAENATTIGTTMLPAITTLTGALSTMLQKIVQGTQNLGTFIGEMLFMGGMDEITFKAKLDLEAEGAFEGLKGRGGTEKMKKLIEERVAQMKKEEAESKKAAQERAKAREKEIQESKDLGKTLEDQIATETDPKRAKALKDRLAAFNELIKAAGDLEEIEASTTEKIEEGTKAKEGQVDPASTEEEEARSSLTGHALRKAANIAGKGEADDGKNIRFEKLATGGFQEFVGGKKGAIVSEKELQTRLQKQIDKDNTNSLLEKINTTLEGKFVAQ
tara:strand:- start:152 stop:1180 length:1029 start_codon:yes stop_codon:yes gene_type:complete